MLFFVRAALRLLTSTALFLILLYCYANCSCDGPPLKTDQGADIQKLYRGEISRSCSCVEDSLDYVGNMKSNQRCLSGKETTYLCEECCEKWIDRCVRAPLGARCL